MSRIGGHQVFEAGNVEAAPAETGVYFLYRGSRLIYIGVAPEGSEMRRRLQYHLRGEEGACTQSATEFCCEASPDPLALYRAYLNVYREWNEGRLPECNEDCD